MVLFDTVSQIKSESTELDKNILVKNGLLYHILLSVCLSNTEYTKQHEFLKICIFFWKHNFYVWVTRWKLFLIFSHSKNHSFGSVILSLKASECAKEKYVFFTYFSVFSVKIALPFVCGVDLKRANWNYLCHPGFQTLPFSLLSLLLFPATAWQGSHLNSWPNISNSVLWLINVGCLLLFSE